MNNVSAFAKTTFVPVKFKLAGHIVIWVPFNTISVVVFRIVPSKLTVPFKFVVFSVEPIFMLPFPEFDPIFRVPVKFSPAHILTVPLLLGKDEIEAKPFIFVFVADKFVSVPPTVKLPSKLLVPTTCNLLVGPVKPIPTLPFGSIVIRFVSLVYATVALDVSFILKAPSLDNVKCPLPELFILISVMSPFADKTVPSSLLYVKLA